ncbi:GEVED domain-containing protein, partial [Streptococcus mitis]|uniref:GEVED domain-containing protein n=1 Tax=Streptococcus mitis TaxID=28037 RepID=UPI0021BDD70F
MKGKQQQDFRTEKYIRYGIRKYSFGAASVAIAAGLMFLGNGAVSATEVQNAETVVATNASDQDNKEKAEPKAETVETVKPETEKAAEVKPEVKVEEAKKVNKAVLEASIATLESKLSTAKYADATVVNSAKEVLATAKATLAKTDASQVEVDTQAELVTALSTVVVESNTLGLDKKQEAEKVEAEKTATASEKSLSEAKTVLDKALSEADVTNRLANAELSKKEVKEENKAAVEAAVAKNQVVLSETKSLLAEKSVTKEQVDAQLARLNESILAVYDELQKAGVNRNGKFEVALADASGTTTGRVDAIKNATLEAYKDVKNYKYSASFLGVENKQQYTADKNNGIMWYDFGKAYKSGGKISAISNDLGKPTTDISIYEDSNANLKRDAQAAGLTKATGYQLALQVGTVFEQELYPGYTVRMEVTALKPYETSEVYKERAQKAGVEVKHTKDNSEITKNSIRYDGTEVDVLVQKEKEGGPRTAGIVSGNMFNRFGSSKNNATIGVTWKLTRLLNGKELKGADVLLADGEQLTNTEAVNYVTDGGNWELVEEANAAHNQQGDVLTNALPSVSSDGNGGYKWNNGTYAEGYAAPLRRWGLNSTDDLKQEMYLANGTPNTQREGGAEDRRNFFNRNDNGYYKAYLDLDANGEPKLGLGTKVMGPYHTFNVNSYYNTNVQGYAAKNGWNASRTIPIFGSRDAQNVSVYINGAGMQNAMIGFLAEDKGDAPATYGEARHSLNAVNQRTGEVLQQPHLGSTKPDFEKKYGVEEVNGKPVLTPIETPSWTGDDAVNITNNAGIKDEGEEQLVGEGKKYSVVTLSDGTTRISFKASSGAGEFTKPDGTNQSLNGKAYVRGWIDFNENGKFDPEEESDVVEVNGNDQDVTLTFTNKARTQAALEGKVSQLGTRIRIAMSKNEILVPTGSAATGEVEDFITLSTTAPKGSVKQTSGAQGEKQSAVLTFTAFGTQNTDHSAANTIDTTKLPVIVSADGVEHGQSYTVAGQGTYTVDNDGLVTFTPEATFVGTADGIFVRRVDKNGNSTGWTTSVLQDKDTAVTAANGRSTYTKFDGSLDVTKAVEKTISLSGLTTTSMDAVYIPTVTPKELEGKNVDSTDIQGKPQKKTPTFNLADTTTAVTPSEKYPAKLVDASGNKVDTLKVDGEGTYTINPTTGEVTFTPEPNFKGTAKPVTIELETAVGADKNGTPVLKKATATYTPTVVGATPTAQLATSTGIQGEEQSGVVSFTAGKATVEGVEKEVPLKANSAVLLDASGNPVAAGTPVDALDPEGNKVGEYTIDPTTNTVKFTPTNKEYKGKVQPANVQAEDENGTKVKTTYTPTIVGVTPTAEPAETTDVQGVEQSKEITFKPGKATINGVEKEVPLKTDSFTLLDESGQAAPSVPAKNPAGDVIGTYTLKVVDGKPTAVFTPTDKTYAGEVAPVTIQAKDTNGTPVTTTYTPNITPVEPTGTPTTSEGAQGQPQEGTPTFTQGNDKVPMKIDATQPAKLIDPATGNPTDETTIPAKDAKGNTVGTYTIEPTTGKVTFTPNKDFVGTPVPATVQAKDANGTPATATYTPTVKPVTPEGINTFTEDIQGAPQSGKPQFTPGKTTIDGKEVEVPMDDNTPAKLVDPTTGQEVTSVTIPGEGTYTVDPDGTVHFTPDKQFTGKGKTLKVVRQDTNGTKVTAEYTAVVKPATPEGTEVLTAAVQGKVQSGKPNFIGGKAEVNGVEKTVDIDKTVPAKLIDPKTGQEATTVTIPGEGTYEVAEDGTVTFTPEKGFVGKGTELTVKRVDLNGTPALGKYTAVVIGTKPTAEPSVTSDIQGQTQSQPVKFKGGTVEVEDPMTKVKTQETVAIDPSTYTLLDESGQPATSVPAKNPAGDVVGTYTLVKEEGKDPVAVFTPTVKSYTGEVKPVTVQAKDTNGVAVTTTYTPNITPVKPTAKAATSEGAQGQEQSGTPTFTEGHEKAPIDKTVPAKLIAPETGEPTDEKSVTVPGEGTYTIDPDTGVVTFKPEPNFTGKATGVEVQRKDTNGTPATAKYTPTVKPVTPTSDDVVSEDIQGAKQTGTPVFTPGKTTVNGETVTIEIDPAVKPTLVGADEEGKVVVPNEGTYTIDENGVVTFTPEPNFTGKASGVTVKRADKNGTEVTAKYTPTVKPVTPTAKDTTTTDVQGVTQKGTPVFTPGKTTVNGVEKTVELSDKPAKLVDPKTGDPVDSVTVDGEGTYTVAPDGTVTFTPNKDFTGQATGVTVKREDKNGTPVTANYTPVVLPVTPTGKDVTSIGEKGAKQSETPVFKAGTTKVNGKTVVIPIDETVAPSLEGADEEGKVVVPNEGTYTIDSTGKVTFTPEPNFVGKASGVTVKRVDENGTPVTATYTPTVLGKTSTKDVTSEGPKNTPQSNTPEFKGDVDTTVPPTFEDGTTEKVVPGEGTYTIDKDGKVTFTPEENFVGTATTVEVVRKDKNGRTIQASYTPTVRPDTKYVVIGKDGKETELIPTKDGKNPSEIIPEYKVVKTETDEKGNTKHIYEKVTTKHLDSKGNPIPGTTTEEGIKDPKTPKEVPGYKLVKTEILESGDIEHIYEKVTTSFKDKEGNEIPGNPTEEGEQPKKDIPGYKFVETKKLPNGDTEHVYEKVTTSFKDKEGNAIPGNPTEEGEQPKKDIPGYRFVETKKLPNGDTEHVYEKVT